MTNAGSFNSPSINNSVANLGSTIKIYSKKSISALDFCSKMVYNINEDWR